MLTPDLLRRALALPIDSPFSRVALAHEGALPAAVAVPVRLELIERVAVLEGRIRSATVGQLQRRRTELERSARGLPDPRMLLGLATQRLDDLSERLRLRRPADVLRAKAERLEMLGRRLHELVSTLLRTEQRDRVHHVAMRPRARGPVVAALADTTERQLRAGEVGRPVAIEDPGARPRVELLEPHARAREHRVGEPVRARIDDADRLLVGVDDLAAQIRTEHLDVRVTGHVVHAIGQTVQRGRAIEPAVDPPARDASGL